MDKWQKLKGFLTDGKEHITKDVYVSRPSVIEKLEGIKSEMDKISELEAIKAEMDNKGWYNRHDKEQFAEIVDKHISELKGETNGRYRVSN